MGNEIYKKLLPALMLLVTLTAVNTAETDQILNKEKRRKMAKNKNKHAYYPNNLSITIIYDNNPYKEGMETAWGFSCVVEGMEETILFDTGGNGDLLLENMKKMKIDPNKIETVVLSHIHGDHTGGMLKFLEQNSDVRVFFPESFPDSFKEKVNSLGAELLEVNKETQVCKKVYSTGQMGTFIKEQGLILRTEKGIILITGCAHPGILKMAQKADHMFEEDILLVMGGFHLEWAMAGKVKRIIKAFKDINVKYAGPCHCTGEKARAIFKEHFGENYINAGAGKVIKLIELN